MSPLLTPRIARSVACLLPALLLWGSSGGCSRRSSAANPSSGRRGVPSFQPADIQADARRAIGERLAARAEVSRALSASLGLEHTAHRAAGYRLGAHIAARLVEIGRELFATDFGLAQGLGNVVWRHTSLRSRGGTRRPTCGTCSFVSSVARMARAASAATTSVVPVALASAPTTSSSMATATLLAAA